MTLLRRGPARASLAFISAIFFMVAPAMAQAPQSPPASVGRNPGLPSETPSTFTPVTSSFDYEKREVMIPMRDGVKLHAVIVIPKGAKNAPILLTRTPYKRRNRSAATPARTWRASPAMLRT